MTNLRATLTDVERGIWHAEYRLDAGSGPALAGSDAWSIVKQRLHGGLSDGVDVVDVDNGRLAASVLPTRGMGLWRGALRVPGGEVPLGWQSPVRRPVHPAFVNASELNGLGWLHGFNELLCRCGLAWNGPPGIDVIEHPDGRRTETPLTLHGRIANIPAHRVDVEVSSEGAGRLRVTGVVDEAHLFGPNLRLTSMLETEAGANWIRITDEIQNLGGQPGEMQLLYHVNIGRPFVEAGARVFTPAAELAPRDARAAEGIGTWDTFAAPEPGFAEQVYYMKCRAGADGRSCALLRNAAGDRGIAVRWQVESLPYFVVWKCTQSEADGCVAGLEPATGFPNPRTFERQQGRVVRLEPEQSYRTELEIAVYATADEVATVEQQIAGLLGDAAMALRTRPVGRWSPTG